ncbi:MAG: 3-carboxyethylcatechol 2,3-dioxygenase [Xanthobacteraceae bacterium]
MAVQLICCSHSPLMTTGIEESEQGVQAQFFRELDSCAAALHKFNPDLVVVFGPDHFNGFFYELMPAFCIGTAAEGSKDWHLEAGPLRVPRELALSCVRHLQSRDFDVALSHAMKVDHGITIPLFKLTGALARYNVLPVFINCAADPRPSFRRVRAFGAALGEFLAEQDMRITVVGSGGLSHDPPTPRIDTSPPGVAQRLIVRQTPTQEELDARENRVVRAARDLVVGKGPCLPPSEQWDRDFLQRFVGARLEDFDAMTDAEIDRVAGFGAHEVRTWVAAGEAAQKMGNPHAELRYYHLVPEWITGMGIVVGQA